MARSDRIEADLTGFIVANEFFGERYHFIRKQVEEVSKISYEIVGVVGALELERRPDCCDVSTLSSGQIGCALSHLNAYKAMVDRGIKQAVVVEDDASLPPDFDKIVSGVARQLREGEIISLHSPTMGESKFSSNDSFSVGVSNVLTPFEARFVRSTLCYIIDIEAARRILAVNQPVRFVADDFNSFWNHGCMKYVRIASPSLVLVEPFKSTIGYLDPGSAKYLVSNFLNKLPITKQILRTRRRKLRLARELNHISVPDVSPLAAGNPNYEE
ncbi:glycosyltransferase family 25 protein [Aquicoccus sp. SU-CL01552]|uniref:glycosyltransferase family 25 protein n=1 Tax=Aquicoccus sp. SU-CL01552 TaxID=3127656 RepID=UPI00310889A3